MKTIKLVAGFSMLAMLFTSCYTEVIIDEDPYTDPVQTITLGELINSYELWYVDIERTSGNGYIPFMQKAFTMSFRQGTLYANNNLVGIGNQGNGFGIDVGYYNIYDSDIDITHDLDGRVTFQVTQLRDNEIELYNRNTGLAYILVGYQRNTFDYNRLFYDNVHYFLQEYVTWEKTYTSEYGNLNEFDYENFVQFLPGGGDGNFQSSQDPNGSNINNIYWDYTGIYNVDDVPGNYYLKYLTLDYDYLGNEYFDMTVLDDKTIELFHDASGTVYRFKGRGYIQYINNDGKLRQTKAEIVKKMVKVSKF
jgi:hypothetical protein